MAGLFSKFNDGGPIFTITIFVLILAIIGLIVYRLVTKTENKRIEKLIIHLGWFALAWGFLGRTFGLIIAFDNIAAAGELTPHLMAEGLKMALVDPLMGITAFLIARGGVIILNLSPSTTLRDRESRT